MYPFCLGTYDFPRKGEVHSTSSPSPPPPLPYLRTIDFLYETRARGPLINIVSLDRATEI